MSNRYFNAHYTRAIAEISEPVIPADDRKGLADMIRFLRKGGILGMLIDVHSSKYSEFSFFGRPARTATSAADMALKYGLLLVPMYGRRLDDDGHYTLHVEPPVPHSTPEEMTQILNDSLEQQVRAHPEQWFWIHRRWKNRKSPVAADI
jgi:KDO2-lipid IV(A) lauroyltransferase